MPSRYPHPLAEVFGYPVDDFSPEAERGQRERRAHELPDAIPHPIHVRLPQRSVYSYVAADGTVAHAY